MPDIASENLRERFAAICRRRQVPRGLWRSVEMVDGFICLAEAGAGANPALRAEAAAAVDRIDTFLRGS